MSTFTVFAWDPLLADHNLVRHGIDFDEATAAMLDPFAQRSPDPDHADNPACFIHLGMSARHRLLLVCRCRREEPHIVRIRDARAASPEEAAHYLR